MVKKGDSESIPKANYAADETTALLATPDDPSRIEHSRQDVINPENHVESTDGIPNGIIDENTSPDDNDQIDEDDKPLPKLQIFLLCYARLVEPVAFFCIFPFISQMIWETGDVAKSDVGFYSGMIESLFSLTQMFLMIGWGRAADKFGRKPVLVFSLAGIGVASSLFGLSKTVWQMIFFRCFAGIFAGTVVTIRAMITENSTSKTQARAFSFFSFTGNLGLFLGPLIGGALANPAKEFPSLFGRFQFFNSYPYALPTIVTGLFGLSSALICAIFLKETLIIQTDIESTSQSNKQMSTWQIIQSPGVKVVLWIYGHLMVLAYGYTAVIPVYWFTPISLGGFNFEPLTISIFMCITGVSQSIYILLIFPPFQRRHGTIGVLKLCFIVYPLLFLFYPIGNILLRNDLILPFWLIFTPGLTIGTGVSMSFTAIQLALNDISPSPVTLGTLNAIALTLVSGLRAISPALLTSIFAWGVRGQILYGQFVWLIMILLCLPLMFVIKYLPVKAHGRV